MQKLKWSLCLVAAALLGGPAHAVSVDWVFVGNVGNAADAATGSLYGAVGTPYLIGTTEVTNAQYAEFLTAKAADDPLGLYDLGMAGSLGGITQGGVSGSFTYTVVPGRENKPVNYVSFYDSLRFANWLNNGQGSGDTETGAYTLLGGTPTPSNGGMVTRNASATIFLPSEDEWYKAAYFDGASSSYDAYPFADGFAGGVCESPAGTTSHSANCEGAVGNTTDVGAYLTSPSSYGTFDQGGNVLEWTEAIVSGSERALRGGGWVDFFPDDLAASFRIGAGPTIAFEDIGFRVASIPEPATSLLLMTGVLGLAGWRRSRV